MAGERLAIGEMSDSDRRSSEQIPNDAHPVLFRSAGTPTDDGRMQDAAVHLAFRTGGTAREIGSFPRSREARFCRTAKAPRRTMKLNLKGGIPRTYLGISVTNGR